MDPILDSISDDSIDPLPLHTIDDNGVIYCSCVSSSKTPRPNLEESVANGVENESSFSLGRLRWCRFIYRYSIQDWIFEEVA